MRIVAAAVLMILMSAILMSSTATAEPPLAAGQRVESLVRQLADGTAEQRALAAQGLAKLGQAAAPAVPALTEALASSDPMVRGWAATALGEIGTPAQPAAPGLLKLLGDREVVDRQPVWERAGRALGRLGPQNVESLLPLLEPSNASYRGAAAALYELKQEAAPALPQVLTILEKRQQPIGPAMYVVQGLGPAAKDAIPVLIELLNYETNPPVIGMHIQYWACQALRDMGPVALPATDALIEKLASGGSSPRRHAAQALGAIGPQAGPQAIEALRKAANDPLQPVRRDALLALAKFGTAAADAAPDVKKLSNDSSKSVRAAAAGALWHIEPAERLHALEVLFDELVDIQAPWEAAEQLATIAPQAGAVDRVIELLAAEDPLTREQAAYALGLMGAAGKPAVARLEKLAAQTDEEPDVRTAAREALTLIRGNSPSASSGTPATDDESPLEETP